MEFSGAYRFRQSPEAIWAALNESEILRATIPGCERIERVSETLFTAAVKLSVGPMKLRFAGQISLSDLDPPWRYTIACEGSGGLAGLARAKAAVTMQGDPEAPDGTGTLLEYRADTALSGMIATLAEKALHGTADRLAGQFFAHFESQIPGPAALPVTEPPSAAAAPAPEETPSAPVAFDDQPGLHPVVWTLGLTVVTAVILAFSIG